MAEQKTDPIEMDRRVAEVTDLILAGLTTREIHRYLRDKRSEWDIGDRQRSTLILRARRLIAKASDPIREEELGRALMRYDVLYRRSFAINDYKTCASIERQITDLLGLAPAKRVEHTGPDGGPVDVNHHLDEAQCDSLLGRVIPALEPRRQAAPGAGDDRLPDGFDPPA